MPRRGSAEQRITQIADAATHVFGRLGYRRTHMADVATEAGLSSGAIYSYVQSKEALFHLVFVQAFGRLEDLAPALPLAAPPLADTLKLIADGLRASAATPLLRAALADGAPPDVRAELAGIVGERYRMIERLWPVLAVIERCAIDVPELEDMYFRRGRRGHIGELSRYLEQRRAGGYLRAMPDVTVAARIITEAITWFAWHRREDRDAALYDDDTVLPTIVEFVSDALIEPA
jgi:AcrR family transcriptional regulator